MTKLNSNGGDDKVDELLKERYDRQKIELSKSVLKQL